MLQGINQSLTTRDLDETLQGKIIPYLSVVGFIGPFAEASGAGYCQRQDTVAAGPRF